MFDDHLGQLLILGAPGSGKTSLLLNLARELLDRAETDIHQPIPVVFNLSSWADRRLPLEDWLTDELRLRSDVPREIARKWVREDQLLLLLDGLDEVAEAHREACAEAINAYRTGHGFVRIAVCSRVAEYEQLTTRLRLPAAILILPLSQSLVLEYLGKGTPLDGVRVAVEADPGLWALLDTPLTLSIVAIVGGNLARDSAAQDRSAAEKRDQLFAYYVDAMFKRRSKDKRYTRDQMQHWLTCLALMLVRREQSIFRIEDLRRNWLETRTARIGVLLAISFIMALISAIFGIVLINAMIATSLSEMFEGEPSLTRIFILIFMALGFVLTLFRGGSIRIVDLVEVRWPGLSKMLRATLEGAILGGVLGFLSGWAGCTLEGVYDWKQILDSGLYWAKIGGLAFGLGKAINSLAVTRELEIRGCAEFCVNVFRQK